MTTGRVVVVVGGLVVDVAVGAVMPVGTVVGTGDVVLVDELAAGPVAGAELEEEPGCSLATVMPMRVVRPPATSTTALVSPRIRASARARARDEFSRGTRLMAPQGGAAPAPARGHFHGPRLATA